MKVIPAIDVISGRTVRLEQGKYDRQLDYEIQPVEAARKWESMGAELIHVVDLDGAKEGRPVNNSVVREIARAVNIPVEVGGGFRKEIDIKDALNHGVWRVVIGSKAFEEVDFARDCLENFHEQVILSLDAREFKPQVRGWEKSLDLDLFDMLEKFVSFGAKELIYTDILRDGTLSGPNTEHLEKILSKVDVRIISAGGIRTVEHVRQLKRLEPSGLGGVIIGRALYEGTIDLKEAINAGKEDNPLS
ncbi:MAG: 1-(5-phosphoribosyl)-5-[(5-phosphoribosylamino)methylideneamino]imidazole-4-carboxamide isomerase [Candidatus Omnitrophota bacterium]|nr:1-(5-phosphoribosyl)-5-[(5-phosphoribosylamino)methylideneamino]imidazole-4-carboxamide isomerase [Candidatus Omnitrophota bacterium]